MPDSLNATLNMGQIEIQTITISNEGGDDLVWEIPQDSSSTCQASVCLSISNININNGTLDIYMTNQPTCSYCTDEDYNIQAPCEEYGIHEDGSNAEWIVDINMGQNECAELGIVTGGSSDRGIWFDGHVGGFQFELTGITITGVTAPDGFMVSTSSTIALAFSLTGATISPSSGVLTTVSFIDYSDVEICFGEDTGSSGSTAISDASGNYIAAYWNTCSIPGQGLTDMDWLSIDPNYGTIAADSIQTIEVTFDATNLAHGLHSTNFTIDSNDPDEQLLTIVKLVECKPCARLVASKVTSIVCIESAAIVP
jgi:hypothetical protein